ncbi:hypothetical protein TpMuguga_03g00363 [Theileria parva strain Muguga]|uniref:Uncharacterized protein n=1 Tax=Theileria parva TaxID=5875 RepID=Q4MZZ1_THEPA|nr:uncharacterized protein TpMuguga_03g00363 [Theileria parva strain Muguga]EAN31100.1 hypothetical protein TpMuguga_03g00363 [Theileria parva strain Muguga]|eukprot:XP_763383.1 hypothetical protein [Theileria parva strain Muguga]
MLLSGLVCALVAASVAADPFLLNADLLARGHPKLAVVHHAAHTANAGTGAVGESHLRYLFLVPVVDHRSHLGDGLASGPLGHAPVVHKALVPDFAAGELMTELVGLSDCKTWHAALVGVWGPSGHHFKHVVAVKGLDGKFVVTALADLGKLVDFVKGKTNHEHVKALFAKGVAGHELLHRVHDAFAAML